MQYDPFQIQNEQYVQEQAEQAKWETNLLAECCKELSQSIIWFGIREGQFQVRDSDRFGRNSATLKDIKFCPWCGKPLADNVFKAKQITVRA